MYCATSLYERLKMLARYIKTKLLNVLKWFPCNNSYFSNTGIDNNRNLN